LAVGFHQARKPPVGFKAGLPGLVVINDGDLHALPLKKQYLQPGVNLPRPAALRGIAGDVEEIGFLVATRTFSRGFSRSDRVPAIAAPPIRQIALGADIPFKLPFGRIAAQGAFHGHFLFLGRHFLHLHFFG
jgi:hypothetical protein